MLYGVSQTVKFTVIDTSTGKGKTGDAANLTMRWDKDAAAAAVLTNTTVTEVDATNQPGTYSVVMSAAESQCLSGRLHGKSATANIEVIPRDFEPMRLPNADPATSGGVLTVGTGSGQLSPSGGNVLLAATGSVALAESYATDGSTATLAQLLYMIWSLLSERSVAATTLTAKNLAGGNSMTFTLDSGTNPTSQTRTT